MLCRALLLCFLLALSVGKTVAQEAAAPSSAEALKPLQFLIGAWNAEAQMPGAGKVTIERTYRLQLSGKFIEQKEVSRMPGGGQVTREMWLGLEPGKTSVSGWAFSSDGSFAILSSEKNSGDRVMLEGRLIGGAAPGVYRSTLQRDGSERFTQTIEVQDGGKWTPYAILNFTRVAAGVSADAASAAPSDAVKPLDLMAGRWRTEGESEGAKFAVDYEILPRLGGYFLRSDYSVTTNGQTELHAVSYLFQDAETKSLRQIGFSADGSVGAMKITPGSGAIVLEGEMATAARRVPMRITYSRPDADTLTTSTEMRRQDGTWRRAGTASLKRRP